MFDIYKAYYRTSTSISKAILEQIRCLLEYTMEGGRCDLNNSAADEPLFIGVIKESEALDLLYDIHEKVLTLAVMPTILGIGIFGNLTFLIVVVRLQRMRTIVNYYLANLAVCDALFLLCGVGGKLFRYHYSPIGHNDIYLGNVGCVLLHGFKDWLYYNSITTVTFIALDRYMAICMPITHRKVQTKYRAVKFLVASWAIGFVMSAILAFAHCYLVVFCVDWPDEPRYADLPKFVGFCAPVDDIFNNVATIFQSVPFIAMMMVNMALYGRIIHAVYTTRRKGTGCLQESTVSDRGQDSRNKFLVTRMLVINGVLFFICLAPFELINLVAFIYPDYSDAQTRRNYRTGMRVCRALMYLNSALNPYIYSVTNPRYREAFVAVFGCSVLFKSKRGGGSSSSGLAASGKYCTGSTNALSISRASLNNTQQITRI